MAGERGSVLLVLLLLAGSAALLSLKAVDALVTDALANRARRQSHLCFLRLSLEHRRVVRRLNVLNRLILANSAAAAANPETAPAVGAALRSAQQAAHGAFVAGVLADGRCGPVQRAWALRDFPYRRGGGLLVGRSLDGTLEPKEAEWKLTTPSRLPGRGLPPHLLEMTFRMEGRFSTDIRAESAERGPGASRSWRPSSSPRPWPSS